MGTLQGIVMRKLQLYTNWRTLVRKAWSIRFILIAGLLSGCEVALPFLPLSMPQGCFAALSAMFCCAAFIARVVAQKDIA